MTKKQFKHDFLRGLGSALIELQSSDNPKQFYDTVLYGCLHNTTYDMQCEGDRGWYLYQAARYIGEKEKIESAVIQKSFQIKDDHWLFDQLTSILYQFATDGSDTARTALYQQYESILKELSPRKRKMNGTYPRRDMFDWLCVWLTSLDGWSMFKRNVHDVSETLLPKDEDRFFSEWFYDNSKGKFGKERIENYLQKQSKKSTSTRTYYEKANEWDKHMYTDERPVPTLEQVLAEADGQQYHGRGLAMRFARCASPEELLKLVHAAMNESDIQKKIELLWPFRRVTNLSFPENALLELHQSGDDRLRDIAFEIMGQNPSSQTREIALSLIQSGEDIENGLSLLSKNLRPEGEGLFYTAVKTFPVHHDEWAWHSAFTAAKDGITVMRGKPKTDILEYIYRQMLCGSCREYTVRLMHKKKVIPDKILQECRFDSNSDVRAFAERIIRFRKN